MTTDSKGTYLTFKLFPMMMGPTLALNLYSNGNK